MFNLYALNLEIFKVTGLAAEQLPFCEVGTEGFRKEMDPELPLGLIVYFLTVYCSYFFLSEFILTPME